MLPRASPKSVLALKLYRDSLAEGLLHNKTRKSKGAEPWKQIWVFLFCSKALPWHWRHFPYFEPICVLFFGWYMWRENHLHSPSFLSFPVQRAGPVPWCLTASSSRPQPLCTTMCRTYSRASCGRSACARTARRTMPAGWPTPRGGKASAKRPSGSSAGLWQRTIRRWLSKQNPSLATTCLCYRSSQPGQVQVGWAEQAPDCSEKGGDPRAHHSRDFSIGTLVNALRCSSKSGSYTTVLHW